MEGDNVDNSIKFNNIDNFFSTEATSTTKTSALSTTSTIPQPISTSRTYPNSYHPQFWLRILDKVMAYMKEVPKQVGSQELGVNNGRDFG
jgi:hypothetical protein